MFQLYNTLTRRKEEFFPQEQHNVRMYSCGPTVYDYPHIGNLRTYIMVDTVKRYLLYKGYTVKHVMNITDVGHLTSDGDEGDDKLEKGAKREGKTVWEIAQYYTDIFKGNLGALNIIEPSILAKATDHIKDQIELIKTLEAKGCTYDTPEAIYFDISKFPDYTKLSGQSLEEKRVGSRTAVHVDPHKRHPQDFVLWFKRVGKFANHTMHWSSPWGEGFPGWHIECSAMSMKYLGQSFDIHIGGVDHIPVHHTNEIAQSEAATGKPLATYWLHGEFLSVDGKKMSKSAGTFITLDDIRNKGFDPLAFRLLVLQAHYRSKLNFTWESLHAAQESLTKIRTLFITLLKNSVQSVDKNVRFIEAMNNDLNTSHALAVFYEHLSHINDIKFDQEKLRAILLDMNRIFGLGLETLVKESVPDEITRLIRERNEARRKNDWEEADSLRNKSESLGWKLEDNEAGDTSAKKI